jgi:hypothetical protein
LFFLRRFSYSFEIFHNDKILFTILIEINEKLVYGIVKNHGIKYTYFAVERKNSKSSYLLTYPTFEVSKVGKKINLPNSVRPIITGLGRKVGSFKIFGKFIADESKSIKMTYHPTTNLGKCLK